MESGEDELFADRLFQFDQLSKLDKWKTTLLLRVKNLIEEKKDDFSWLDRGSLEVCGWWGSIGRTRQGHWIVPFLLSKVWFATVWFMIYYAIYSLRYELNQFIKSPTPEAHRNTFLTLSLWYRIGFLRLRKQCRAHNQILLGSIILIFAHNLPVPLFHAYLCHSFCYCAGLLPPSLFYILLAL